MINDCISCFSISEAPHGGMKSSGLGRTHGRWGLEEMVRVKYVDNELLPQIKKVWWFGYGKEFSSEAESFLDVLFGHTLLHKMRAAVTATAALWRRKL